MPGPLGWCAGGQVHEPGTPDGYFERTGTGSGTWFHTLNTSTRGANRWLSPGRSYRLPRPALAAAGPAHAAAAAGNAGRRA
jgi:hypothetical protein